MAEPSSNSDFFRDLRELQDKYPMCYVQAWTPDDWQQYLTPADNPDEDDLDYEEASAQPADWDEPIHCQVAGNLEHRFDANLGTHWYTLECAVDDCKGEDDEQTVHSQPE